MPQFWVFRTIRLRFLMAFSVLLAGNVTGSPAQDRMHKTRLPQDSYQSKQTNCSIGIPGEFERQAALVLSWKSDEVRIIGTLLEICRLAVEKAPVVVLVSSAEEHRHAQTAFRAARIDLSKVKFLEAPVNTIWARDFGPVIVRNADGTVHFVDSDYDDGDRPEDDNIPAVLASEMSAKCVRSLLTIEGGNLLSNGAGLCLTTSKTVCDNVMRGYEHLQIQPLFRKMFQCSEVVFLEPLVGEPTGHVDMFASFTSANTVVVGQMDPAADPVNASILDRNAARLSGLMTPHGELRVVRIPMPTVDEGLWRSFTNVLYFNGVLVMPTYEGVDPEMERAAVETYRRLLPDWIVQGVDCTQLIRLGGAIHCVTLNLPTAKAGRLPATEFIYNQNGPPVVDPSRNSFESWDDFEPRSRSFPQPAGIFPRPADRDDRPYLHRSAPSSQRIGTLIPRSPARTRNSDSVPQTMFDHPEYSSFPAD